MKAPAGRFTRWTRFTNGFWTNAYSHEADHFLWPKEFFVKEQPGKSFLSDGVVYFGGLDGKLYAVSTAQ